jgi:L-seryl-tRNA(Ser) seleniumtransferase
MGGMNSRRFLLLLLLAPFTPASGADLTGSWTAQVELSAGSGSPTFRFEQKGEALQGDYSGALGSAKLTGTVKGSEVEFSFFVEPQGEKIKITYTGALQANGTLKGTVQIEGLGDGTFTATRN